MVFFLLQGSKEDEHRKPITASFICRDRYELYATLDVKDLTHISHSLPIYAYVSSCTPAYANLFCLKANDTEWERSFCRLESDIFKCPLFPKFKSYFDFFKWKISTMAVKVVVFYGKYQEIFATVSRSVSPLFTCTDIRSVQEDDKIFDKN